jgi:hypothetical protein
MPLITLEEVKGILQLTADNSYDETIESLIPFVRNLVCFDILQNTFLDALVYYKSNSFTFSKADGWITDSLSGFSENYFVSGLDVRVIGSYYNDGLYEIKTVAGDKLTLTFENAIGETLTDESPIDSFVTIRKVNYPKGLKVPTARLIQYLLNKEGLKGVKSESLVSYSVTYAEEIPKEILGMFNKYKKLSW